MGQYAMQLKEKTDPEWVNAILEDFDAFLRDHADCERKASAMAFRLRPKPVMTSTAT